MEQGEVTNVNPEDMLEMELILLDNDITFSSGRFTTHSALEDLVANPERYRGDDFAIQGKKRHPLHLGDGYVTFNDTYGTFPWDTDLYWEDGELVSPREIGARVVAEREELLETHEWVDDILEKVGEIPEWGNLIVEHNDHPGLNLYPLGEEPVVESEEDVMLALGVKLIEEGLRNQQLDGYFKDGVEPWQVPYIGYWAPKEHQLGYDRQSSLWDFTTGEYVSWDQPPENALEVDDLAEEWTRVEPEERFDRSQVEYMGQLLEEAGYSFDRDPREDDVDSFVTTFPQPPKVFWVES